MNYSEIGWIACLIIKKADEDGRRDINDSNSLFNKVSKKLISVSPVFSKRIDAYRSNINVEKKFVLEEIY